jgi:hypothetical protein
MFENEQEFRKVVAGLRIDAEPNPAHRERLRRQMLQRFEEAGRPALAEARRPAPRTVRLWNTSLAKLAVAAVVLIAATVVVRSWLASTGGPTTLNQVRLATKKMPWLHAVVSTFQNGDVRTQQHWYNFEAEQAYVVMDDGAVLGWQYGPEREKLAYSPRLKALMISELPRPGFFGADSAYNLVDAFAVLAARNDVDEWTAEHEGKTVRAFGLEMADPDFRVAGRPVARLKIALVADPGTNRVVAANIEHRGKDGNLLAREEWVMSYPPSGPASIYDAGVPRTARVVDTRQGYIGTPGAEPTPSPTPERTAGPKLAPLEISLPKARFIGTPRAKGVPNLEKPRKGPRPPFLAPLGTTNVALGKPVTSSDRDPLVGSLDLITDGDKEITDGSFVELGPFPQYVTIDLREPCEIYAVVVWHHHRWPRVYFDVAVQVSNSRTFRSGVTTVFNNDTDNSLGLGAGRDMNYTETNEGKLIDCKGVRGRYVRLYSNGNTNDELNHYIEVEVYGRPLR